MRWREKRSEVILRENQWAFTALNSDCRHEQGAFSLGLISFIHYHSAPKGNPKSEIRDPKSEIRDHLYACAYAPSQPFYDPGDETHQLTCIRFMFFRVKHPECGFHTNLSHTIFRIIILALSSHLFWFSVYFSYFAPSKCLAHKRCENEWYHN